MDIDRCNSVFELFSAFNFTYAVLSHPNNGTDTLSLSDNSNKSFADIVDSYLIKPFSRLITLIEPVELKVSKLKESLDTAKKSLTDPKKLITCNELLQQVDDANRLINIWKDEIDKSKDNAKIKINQRFPYASFLLALFCLSVLILAASESKHKHLTLLLIDILLLIEVTRFFIMPERTDRELTYRNILYYYIGGLFIITLAHFSLKFYFHSYHIDLYNKSTNLIDKNELIRPFFILLNIVIPFSHFIYYYISFRLTLMRKNLQAEQQIPLIVQSVDRIQTGHDSLGSITV